MLTTFWLGTHQVRWLERTEVPLFVSARRLRDVKRPPKAAGRWALDSGAFTELKDFGKFVTPAKEYAGQAERWQEEIGNLAFAAPQDWMCEPFMLAKTGLTVFEHQQRSTESYIELMALALGVPWIPVLQGWTFGDYLRHAEDYDRHGIDLTAVPLVGLGSVCRRQGTDMVCQLAQEFHEAGVRLHGFGVKTQGLLKSGKYLASADSMAWSFTARRKPVKLPQCIGHKNCANCMTWALLWRTELLARLEQPVRREEACDLFEWGAAHNR